MKRLDTKTLPAFLAHTPIAVLFVSSNSDSTIDQAEQFALLWMQAVVAGLASVQFAYVDGDANPEVCRRLGVTGLPSTLVLRDGAIARSVERPSALSLHALVSSDVMPTAKRPAAAPQRIPDMLEAA
jgi:hypothetical protein